MVVRQHVISRFDLGAEPAHHVGQSMFFVIGVELRQGRESIVNAACDLRCGCSRSRPDRGGVG